MIGRLLYFLLFAIAVLLIAILPFCLIYLFANFVYFFLRYLVKYRIEIAQSNLKKSFPKKDNEELGAILNATYRNLADVIVETLKGFTISKRQIRKRYIINNPELLEPFYERGQSVIGVAGHLANWEWGALAAGLRLKHKPVAFYKPLNNPLIDRLMRWTRMNKGTHMVSIAETVNIFKKYQNEPSLFILVADQSPSNFVKAFWVDFLNQDTPCLHGPEKYAHIYNFPLVFIETRRIKRGYYCVDLSLLSENPQQLAHGEVTRLYMERLEAAIQKNPSSWLWTHKRWKQERPPYLILPKHGKTIP